MSNFNDSVLFILQGSTVTIKLFLVVFILSIPLAAIFKNKLLKKIVGIYTWLFRGTPLLLQLFFIYFGLPVLGIKFSRFTAATIAFTLNYAAYLTEIFRGGLQSVDKG